MSIDLGAWQRAQWQGGENLLQMLGVLASLGRRRQLRLFALACAERVRDRMTDPRSVAAVAFAERYVGPGWPGGRGGRPLPRRPRPPSRRTRCTGRRRPNTRSGWTPSSGWSAARWRPPWSIRTTCTPRPAASQGAAQIGYVEWAAANGHWPPDWQRPAVRDAHRAGQQALIALLCDIAGDPFRPPPDAPAWRSHTVVALARGIDEDRAFDRLPILADAMQDAGCEDAEALDHCRGPGPHARGCWVVEQALGRG